VAPVIQSLTAAPTHLTVGEATTLSALVGDVDGDLLGGTLVDVTSGATLGTFATPGGQGTFTFLLTWDALDAAAPIDGTSGLTRVVRGVFVDAHGHHASADVSLVLGCGASDGGTRSLCSGACVDLSVDAEHCGQCRHAVPTNGVCVNGAPSCGALTECNGACVDLQSDAKHCGTCGNDCEAWGTAHALPSNQTLVCTQGTCLAWSWVTTREPCSTACAAVGLTCSTLSLNNCSGTCASYVSSSSFSCTVLKTCAATPAATSTCSGQPATFSAEQCNCQ
jgi:hypothetical protein